MIKLAISLALVATTLAAPAVASAQDSFEGVARKARRIDGAGLAALFWSQTEDCDKAGGDFARRQCVGLRNARRAQLSRETFVIDGGAAALHGGAWDAKTKKLPLAIDACVACDGGVEIDGKRRFVTGKGSRKVAGGALRAPALGQVAIALPTQADADAWRLAAKTRVRSEFVIKVPAQLDSWRAGDLGGYGVDVVAYRVWDACDGRILSARPRAGRAEADRTQCPVEKAKVIEKVAAPVAPVEPERVSSTEVNEALAPIRAHAQKCFETYGVAGKAVLQFTFDRKGKITALSQEGDFTETPTGSCIDKAARAVGFPPSQNKTTTVSFPLTLE
jgi:hypothetical protein